VNDIPIAILDEDHSSLSRMVIQQFDQNGRFNVKAFVDNTEELKELVNSKKIYMGVCIPAHFSDDVSNGASSEVLITVDGSNMVIGNNSFAAASTIIQTIAAGAEIKRLEADGIVGPAAKSMANPFVFTDRMLYNPKLAYMNYLLLGYIAVFLQQVMLSGVGIQMIKDGERIAGRSIIKETFLKILSCAFYALMSATIAIFIAAGVFHVNIRGSIPLSMLFCLMYAFAISGPAILIAAIVKDKLKHVQIAYMLSLPAFVSCGYIWPQDQMPWILVLLIKCIWPLMFFARPFDELLFKGIFPTEGFIGLALYTLIWLPVSIMLFNDRFKGKLQYQHNPLADIFEP
jgi:ABC-2 type transport system permease protein